MSAPRPTALTPEETDSLVRIVLDGNLSIDERDYALGQLWLALDYGCVDSESTRRVSSALLDRISDPELTSASKLKRVGNDPWHPYFEVLAMVQVNSQRLSDLYDFIDSQTDPALRCAAANCLDRQYSRLSGALASEENTLEKHLQRLKNLYNSSGNEPKLQAIIVRVAARLMPRPQGTQFVINRLYSPYLEVVNAAATSATSFLTKNRQQVHYASETERNSFVRAAMHALTHPNLEEMRRNPSASSSYGVEYLSLECTCIRSLLGVIYQAECPTGNPGLFFTMASNSGGWFATAALHILGHSGPEALPYVNGIKALTMIGNFDHGFDRAQSAKSALRMLDGGS